MEDFRQYLHEKTNDAVIQKALIDELMKAGFSKFKTPTRSRIYVYVAKSERMSTVDNIKRSINGAIHDTSGQATRISSAGVITFNQTSPFFGIMIAVKPDASKDLSTDEQESLQGIFISAAFRIPNTEFGMEDLNAASKFVQTKFSVNHLMNKASDSWVKSAAITAKTLAGSSYSGDFIICQRSKSAFINRISKAASTLLKDGGHSIQLDKWNPADIWMVNPKYLNAKMKSFSSIQEMNEVIKMMFDDRELIGVSLKKVGSTAKIQVFNYDRESKSVKHDSHDMGKSGFINAMDMNLYFNNTGRVTIRSFGRPVNVNAEIQGKHAAGGKVGASALFGIFKDMAPRLKIKDARDITRDFETDPEKLLKQLHQWGVKLDPSTMRSVSVEEYAATVLAKKNVLTYCISKWQVCQMAMVIDKMSESDKDMIIQQLVDYASSSTDVSSVFIKVS
jgi:hypothetical protein